MARGPSQIIKQFLPKSLLGRSLMIIVTPLVLLQIVSTWIFFDRHWETITRRLSNSIAGDIGWVIEEMREQQDLADATGTNPGTATPGPADGGQAFAQLFDKAHRHMNLRVEYKPEAILPNIETSYFGILDSTLAHALSERVRKPFAIDTSSFKTRVIIDVQLPDAVLTVTVPGERLFSSTTYIFILWMVGTSLVLFAVAVVFMRNQVRPIRRLAQAADAFGKGGDMGRDFRIQGATEVRLAPTPFTRLRERINRQIRQRTDMLSGVSHDLRTPLTRMKLQLAMIGNSPEVSELRNDLADMETLIEGYLTFARGEGDEPSVDSDLAELLRETVDRWKRNGLTIDAHIEDRIDLPLKPNAFGRCLDNLIVNAGKYGQHVWVRAGIRGNAVEIVVDDDGPGVPADERENIFRPFYRLDQSRNPDTGGTGLGLAIARDIARGHGGDIELDESPQEGLRATIRLPL